MRGVMTKLLPVKEILNFCKDIKYISKDPTAVLILGRESRDKKHCLKEFTASGFKLFGNSTEVADDKVSRNLIVPIIETGHAGTETFGTATVTGLENSIDVIIDFDYYCKSDDKAR